jgi:16S rRNA (cytidine1402-2'-O)-methyltransferase
VATLYLVSTPIGNLGDLSIRAGETLKGVRRILAEDTRRTGVLARHVGSSATLVSLHAHNEAERTERVLAWLDEGDDMALVSDAGTPLVSDPGGRLVEAVVRHGHTVVPIPGASAVLAALTGSGLPAARFAFLGFPERKGRGRAALLRRVASSAETVVLFESPNRVVGLLEDLAGACGSGRRVSVARELTKVHEEFVRGTLVEAAGYYREHPPKGEVTLVVAPAEADPEADEAKEERGRELARELLAEGMKPSRAAREVASRLDVPRNAAYRIVHALDDEPPEPDAP